jgi:hypothetical protein
MRSNARDVDNEMNRQRNCLACAAMGKADVRCQYTVSETREGLLGGIGVNGAQAA